ncbi:helix-turn-helix transcriptional regulator [Hymenobacter sp. ISL-91]|uniref:helix-turn-helix domain-containing protein n=1 Tax=Hymenobacter sp. ISL-91 TaxID=2819151 RepID=UPI001BEBC350|nr:helix-turn-helix transcriptional regulator [Hymenobacter sp. ISL-91]MBT2557218.1 helix-turn-helix transcriptional regulator [Hymenobacter sp. ISL-91]
MDTHALRTRFGLSQDRMADWLGVPRSSLALAERGYQAPTATTGVQELRLTLAVQGLVYDGTGGSFPTPPALPEPPPDLAELGYRLRQCQAKIQGLELQLVKLQQRAAPYVARLAATPALRAYPGLVDDAEDEAAWLTIFELEARRQLREHCGATARLLLEARLAGLQREAELLAEIVEASATP